MPELFGFRFGKATEVDKVRNSAPSVPSFVPPPNSDGSMEIASGDSYGTYMDLEASAKNETELITKYRELAMHAEVDGAIDDIVNEAIIREDNKSLVEINLTRLEQPDKVKDRIREEFELILKLLDFNNIGYDIFRRWYVDGRMYYHMMIDEQKPREGIVELRYIDPRRIRRVRSPKKKAAAARAAQNSRNIALAPDIEEYYIYNPGGSHNTVAITAGVKISTDSIAHVHSGILDQRNQLTISHLHKAIKPMNQLRMLEDATVIYRLSRAPERRIFYIDVGNLPKIKAEQYLHDMMARHKNRIVYDAATGEVRDNRKFMTMLEDFWLPRREGGKGTEITTLPGGQNLGEMDDVEYFRRKVYKALNVPNSRIQTDSTFNFGRSGEITRDEIKFSRMIDRLRIRFSHLFDRVLETQLILKGVITRAEWKEIKESIHYDFLRDNYFSELKDQEITNARLGILQNIDPYVGKYFSTNYVRTNILRMTEEEIAQLDKEIATETSGTNEITSDTPTPEPVASPTVQQEQKELTEEDKILIASMTKALDGVTLSDIRGEESKS